APVLGASADFALFSKNGAVSNTGLSQLTGNVGTNNGAVTNFGNVDGVMHNADGATATAAADLTIAYNQLNAAVPTLFPASLLGNGQVLTAGIYSVAGGATLSNSLTLNGQGNANAVFIFQVQGAMSSTAASSVLLTNGAQACNVFWKVEGAVSFAANTAFKGTLIANNAAIVLNAGTSIEGRALSTTGAVTVSGVKVTTPLGCGRAVLNGPASPPLASVACYTLFSGNGAVTNTGISFVTGDVGTNVGLTTGYQALNVAGTVHPNPDVSTAQCAADLGTVYTFLNTLPTDIELLYPASFGNGLVLTPHTYLLDGAAVLTGEVSLNAQNNANAVFVIKIKGALSTSTYASVALLNGAQAKNVFWKVDGAVNLNDYADFKGTIVANNGAVSLNTGVTVTGRALTTNGAFATFGINAQMTPGCNNTVATSPLINSKPSVSIYPSPFSSEINVSLEAPVGDEGANLTFYNSCGVVVLQTKLTQKQSNIPLNLPRGIYIYKVVSNNNTYTGKLVSQ
ncbi:MAG: ice-binding family protein, partial [Bacteroidota bacterium]